MADRTEQATVHPGCQPEGEPPPPSRQQHPPSTVDVACGQCCNCISQSTCVTRWYTCHIANRLCSNWNYGPRCRRRKTGTQSDHPPGVTPEGVRQYSTGTTLAPPTPSTYPPPICIRWPLIFRWWNIRGRCETHQLLWRHRPSEWRLPSSWRDRRQQILAAPLDGPAHPAQPAVWPTDGCGKVAIPWHPYHTHDWSSRTRLELETVDFFWPSYSNIRRGGNREGHQTSSPTKDLSLGAGETWIPGRVWRPWTADNIW